MRVTSGTLRDTQYILDQMTFKSEKYKFIMIACRFLILFELFNRNTNFLCNRTIFFSKHKLSPVPLTWLHTLDEAMSVGLAKACALRKKLFCYREN